MAVIQIKSGFSGWRRYRPQTMPCLAFCDLQPGTVLGDSYIQGFIVTKWPVQKYKDSHLLKLVIQEVLTDDDNPKHGTLKLNVFILGNLFKQWDTAIVGDYVCLTDVCVEGFQNCARIVMKENVSRPPRAWLLKKSASANVPEPSTQGIRRILVPPKRPHKPGDYRYTALKDIKPSAIVNVWGVVKFHKPPSKSKAQDYSQTISIVDPSLTKDKKVVCVLFARRPSQLPNLHGQGQILRFHRLRVQAQNQATSGPGFTWLLFDSKMDAPMEPTSSGTVSYTYDENHKEKLIELRRWMSSQDCIMALEDMPPVVTAPESQGPACSASVSNVTEAANDSIQTPPLNDGAEIDDIPSAAAPEPATSRKTRGETDASRYTKLKNLTYNTTVNVLGVITFVAPVKQTITREYLKVVSIVDQSESNLKCTLFANTLSLLPDTAMVGQIICFHGLSVTRYAGKLQGKRGRGFSWSLYDSRQGAPAEMVSTSNIHQGANTTLMSRLQQWAEGEDLLRYQKHRRISEVEPSEYFDLVCQVVAMEKEDDTCIRLRVWDGSKPSVRLYEADSEVMANKSNRTLVEQSYGISVDVFVYEDHFPAASRLKPGDFIGLSNLHAMRQRGIDDPDIRLCLHRGTTYSRGLRLLDPNTDVMVTVLKERLNTLAPGPSGGFTSLSNIPPSPQKRKHQDDDTSAHSDDVPRRKSQRLQVQPVTHQLSGSPEATGTGTGTTSAAPVTVHKPKSSDSSEEPRCMQQSATVLVGHHHIAPTSLSEVMTRPPPNKYRIRVQLIDYRPRLATSDSIYRMYCPACHDRKTCPALETPRTRQRREETPSACPECKKAGNTVPLQRVVQLELIIADSSGWLLAYLWGDEADTFFADIMHPSSPTAQSEIYSYLEVLSPPADKMTGRYNRPWMECCVTSYTAQGQTCFNLFDTMIAATCE